MTPDSPGFTGSCELFLVDSVNTLDGLEEQAVPLTVEPSQPPTHLSTPQHCREPPKHDIANPPTIMTCDFVPVYWFLLPAVYQLLTGVLQ